MRKHFPAGICCTTLAGIMSRAALSHRRERSFKLQEELHAPLFSTEGRLTLGLIKRLKSYLKYVKLTVGESDGWRLMSFHNTDSVWVWLQQGNVSTSELPASTWHAEQRARCFFFLLLSLCFLASRLKSHQFVYLLQTHSLLSLSVTWLASFCCRCQQKIACFRLLSLQVQSVKCCLFLFNCFFDFDISPQTKLNVVPLYANLLMWGCV